MARGDVVSKLGRFAPLSADHPMVGDRCVFCGQALSEGDRPALVEWGPGSDEDAAKAAEGRAHNVECKPAHERCAWPTRGVSEFAEDMRVQGIHVGLAWGNLTEARCACCGEPWPCPESGVAGT